MPECIRFLSSLVPDGLPGLMKHNHANVICGRDVLAKVRREFSGVEPERSPNRVAEYPYLAAAVQETMRMYPMILGPLERYLGKEIEFGGEKIPPES